MKKKILFFALLMIISAPIFAKALYYEESTHVGAVSVNTVLYFSDKDNKDLMWNEFSNLKKKAEYTAYVAGNMSGCAGNYYLTGIYKNGTLYQICLNWWYNPYSGAGTVLVNKGKNSSESSVQIFQQTFTDFNSLYAEFERQCDKYINML